MTDFKDFFHFPWTRDAQYSKLFMWKEKLDLLFSNFFSQNVESCSILFEFFGFLVPGYQIPGFITLWKSNLEVRFEITIGSNFYPIFCSCCQSDVGRFHYAPISECFEMNGCHGLQWTPNHGCLEETIMNIGKKLMN